MNRQTIDTIEIVTDRLILRPLRAEDYPALCVLDTDPDVRAFFPEGVLTPPQIAQELARYLREWQLYGFSLFAVIDKKTHQLIGRAGFAKLNSGDVELGYLFLKSYWGQGYATEAARALLVWAKDHIPVDYIVGFAPKNHLASLRSLEKCGMQFDRMDQYREIECVYYKYPLR